VTVHPQSLGKYPVTGVLGEGAMGVVYRGFDPDIRRVVALKTVRQQPGHGPEALAQSRARFRNEAQAAGRLLHPGIVGVYDYGEHDDGSGRVAYIAMEYVEGHTLSRYLARRVAFGIGDVAAVGVQLAEALAHAHEHGVWHRDVKPSNVIMTRAGRIKVADFGIARTESSALTMAGSVLGTPMYMAPEQFVGRAIDHRVDVYGAGVVLYQMVAGRPPFVGTAEALMYQVVNEAPPPPSAVDGGSGQGAFDAVILRALAKEAQERWPDAATLADALRQACTAATGAPVPSSVAAAVVQALPFDSDWAPTERLVRPPGGQTAMPALAPSGPAPAPTGGSAAPPSHWDAAVLAGVEAALARHVGPLAGVMVRRAARDCADVSALVARLAEQITSASAREAFLRQMAGAATGGSGTGSGGSRTRDGAGASRTAGSSSGSGAAGASGGGAGSGRSGGSVGSAAGGVGATGAGASTRDGAAAVQITDDQLEHAVRVLAAHVGPIARVVVRRAAERTRERDALFAALADAVPEAARQRLLAELARVR
jgi:serine/threonine-protein kinase